MFQEQMLIAQDLREDYGEDRFQGIGFIQNRMVVIIYTEPEEDLIRIISLRKATKHERERFTQDLANRLGPR